MKVGEEAGWRARGVTRPGLLPERRGRAATPSERYVHAVGQRAAPAWPLDATSAARWEMKAEEEARVVLQVSEVSSGFHQILFCAPPQ